MKILLAAGAALALCAAPAFADTMDAAYGNTITVTYPSGAVASYHFNADGTFTGVAPGGSQMAGRWEIAGEQICLLAPSGQRNCTEFHPEKQVGDSWTQTAADGSQITIAIVAGR